MSQRNPGDKARTRGKSVIGPANMATTAETTPSSPGVKSPCKSRSKNELIEESALTQILARFDRMEERMKVNIIEISTATEKTAAEVARLSHLMTECQKEREADKHLHRQELLMVQHANKVLMDKVNELENRSKLCNIKMEGKVEDEREDLKTYIAELIEFISPEGVTVADVESISRIGKVGRPSLQHNTGQRNGQRPTKPRSIMVIFKSVQARNAIYYRRVKLNKSERYAGIYLNDDVTTATRKNRDDFRSVAALARSVGSEVRVHDDGIVIDGKKFRHTDPLPDKYSLDKAKTVNIQGDLYFHSEHSFLSNFYPSPICEGGIMYPSAEHYFQASKCKALNDTDRLTRVLKAQTPLEAKQIADQIPETAEWRGGRETLLKAVIDSKFEQNTELADKLIGTGSARLMEATNNTFYGIGATLHSRALRDRSYSGLNVLGQVLAAKRDSLKTGKK